MSELDDMLIALDESTMVTITDGNGTLLYVNKLFCDISKYSKDELIGQKPNELLKSGFHTQEFYDEIWDALSQGNTWRGDVKNKAKDGSFFWTLTTIMPFIDDDGKPFKFIAIRKDITDKVDAEEKLQEYNEQIKKQKEKIEEHAKRLEEVDRLKEEFMSMITHELKTPLVPINGYCQMLEEKMLGELNDDQIEAVQEIYQNAKQLEGLIADVLDATKLDMKKMTFKKEDSDIAGIMQRVEKDMSFIIKAKKISFVNSTQVNGQTIKSDENRILQVIENLIKNAVDFVPEETGKIEINAKKENDHIRFSVKDNGIGMTPEQQGQLFQKFFQANASAKRKHGGTGLGLVICKGLVEGMGGQIGVESESGKGSTFYFNIPLGN